MEDIGLPELTTEQIEELCAIAENAARKYILAQVPSKMVERLNISIEALGLKPLNLTIEIDLALSPQVKNVDPNRLVNDAAKEALKVSEKYLRKQT